MKKEVNKILDDLDTYRNFCRFAWINGHNDSYVFNEKDLYNPKTPWGIMHREQTRQMHRQVQATVRLKKKFNKT